MSTVVAVAGGSSGLGRAIVEALKEDGRYEPLIFSRKENPQVEHETGVRVLAADYSSVDALTTLLETNNVTVLISTAHSLLDPTPEFNMIQAASRSRPTKRFIPNAWSSIEPKDEPRFRAFPLFDARLQALSQLRATTLEWTTIYPGLFMEVTVQGLPSHISAKPLVIDVAHNTAALPNKGEARISLTYSRDIARYIPKLLALETWEQRYFIAGDVRSWNEIVAAAEKGKGVKFDVRYDGLEKLERGEVTELLGFEALYEEFGGRENAYPVVQRFFSTYGLWMEEELMSRRDGKRLEEVFPEVRALTLEEAWELAGKA